MKEVANIAPGSDGSIWWMRRRGPRHMHRHDEPEINLVTRGHATYVLSDRRYDLRKNTLVWLFADQDHVLFNESPDFEMFILVFKSSLVQRICKSDRTRLLLERNPTGELCKLLRDDSASELRTLFKQLHDAKQDQLRFNFGIAYALLTAWDAHLSAQQVLGTDVHPAVERAARIIQAETDPLSLEDIAEQVGLSPSRLSRLFHQQSGVSLVQFRQRQNLERFFRIYGDGQTKTIMAAALQAGFGSYPQFHRVFKQLVGKTPAQYHQELTKREG
ncbi:MAG TPA: AraC family transcriptional regulator [Tepidisphaeraceae bacterium]|jgi:AraC-like DNA-binding protein|nr:AraC family transcriptional regulator [Tepidisphaeraceae bacterium]